MIDIESQSLLSSHQIIMFLLFFITWGCHQKDPDPVVPSKPQLEVVQESPPPAPPKPTTALLPIDPWSIHPSLAHLEELLHAQQWEDVLKYADQISNEEHKAIIYTWAYKQIGSIEKALPYFSVLNKTNLIPQDLRDYLCAEILLSDQKEQEAYALLEQINESSPWFQQAQSLLLSALPDPQRYNSLLKKLPNTPTEQLHSLLSQLLKSAQTSDQRFYILKQIFTKLPKTQLAIETNPELKKKLRKKGYVITQKDRAVRAESLMRDNLFVALTKEYKKHISYGSANETMCRIWYAYGRSLFKVNKVTAAQKPLLRVATKCKGIRDDLGAKAYYIAAKGLDRKKDYEGSAKLFASIPEHYPSHSMADDGYLLAGIGWQNIDKIEQALPLWSKQIETFPNGDMIFEGYWRLAWGLYLSGKPSKAIEWSNRSYQETLKGDITHAMALRYWGARWKIYPDHNLPTVETTNTSSKEKGIEELLSILLLKFNWAFSAFCTSKSSNNLFFFSILKDSTK